MARWHLDALLHGLLLGATALAAGAGCANTDKRTSKVPVESQADKLYDVAVGSFHNGMFIDAKMQLDRALTDDPEHPNSHYLQGVLLLNEGKTIVDAIETQQCLVDDAADQQRDRAEALHRKAADEFRRAASFFEEGAAGRGRALNSMAVVSLHFHEDTDAARLATEALAEQFYTNRYSALSNLGWAHYQQGDLVSATAQLRQAVLINPQYCVAHYRLAQVYLETGIPERALEHAQLVTQAKRCPIQDAHRIEGVAALRMKQKEDAHSAFQSCVEMAPRSCLAEDCRRLLGSENAGETTVARHVAQP